MSFLSVDHVTHYYFSKSKAVQALKDVSFSVDQGEFVSILGPSGCGKSTILSLLAHIIQPSEGNITLNGQPISTLNDSIGYMLQQDYLFPWKTIMDNVLLGPKIKKTVTSTTINEAEKMLNEVGLHDISESYPDALSGGMRQRVALVRTLITDPEVLLLDEPFSALDYVTKLSLENAVSELLHAYKKTTVLVTHDIGEAISMSDRIIIMNANPGSIHKIYEVPIELRNERPFDVRRHPKYQIIFDKIWDELNTDPEGFVSSNTAKAAGEQHD